MKHVFISSTFKDMQFERDALHSLAAININERLAPYGEQVYFGDLRWGVNTTSLDSDEGSRRVLEVCLDEIDDCRPYMIVLIGERYGWIPDASLIRDTASAKGIDISEEMSVTQLEIEYGAFLSPEYKGRVFFYFRELDTTGMTDEQLSDYLAESETHNKRVNALKARIRESYPDAVRSYTARFDSESQRIDGLQDFLDMVESDLSKSILADIESEEQLPWQERAMLSAERYYLDISRNYYPLEHRPISLFDGVASTERTRMKFVKGNSGTGKSMLVANNYREIYEIGDSCRSLPFVLGLDKYSSCEMDYFKILLYMLEKLSGQDGHRETFYGDPAYDQEIFDEIIFLECEMEGTLHSFIDNCSYELSNALSIRLLDEHLRKSNITYLAINECSCEHLDFVIAYSADEQTVILPPWFDYSRTYVLDTVSEQEQIPLIKTILRQKHKELDDSVISAIAEKEEARSPFYLSLAIDRMLMLDSTDFAQIRAMGDGMDNINRYQISVVKALPETTQEMASELVCRVGKRVNTELVMRLMGVFAYSGIRMRESEVETVFSSRGWDYSTLDFALATRSLSAILNYNPKDKSYAVTNPDVIYALELLLKEEEYTYVAGELYDHITQNRKGTLSDALFRVASYVDAELLCSLYIENKDDKKSLAANTAWLIKRQGVEFTAMILKRVVTECPDHDFSFILSGIPTACLTVDDHELYETLLQSVLDEFGELSQLESDINRNSFTVIAWTKMVSMKMKVNTSDASPLFHSFIDNGYRFYPMSANARVRLDITYYRYLALEAYYSMNIIIPESDTPLAEECLEELEGTEERVLLGAHLFGSFAAYLRRAFEPISEEYYSYARRGYEALGEYLKDGDYEFVTADDVAEMIDCMLDDRDDNSLRADVESVSNAIEYMTMGQTHVNSRLLKYLPRILASAKYAFDGDECDFSEETVNILKRLCATSRAVAGSALTVNDFLYATVQMSEAYDILSERLSPEEHIALITHLDKFVNFTLADSDGDPRVFYRCYLAIRKLFTICELYEFDDARNSLLDKLYDLEISDEEAPILPELFLGSLIYRYSHSDNGEICAYLRDLADTVENDPDYSAYASAYSPELMCVRLDIRTPEEIAADDEYASSFFSYDGDECDNDEEDDEYYGDDSDESDDFEDGDESDEDGTDDDQSDGDSEDEMSIEDMVAFLEGMGLTLDDLFGDDDEDGE